MADIPIVQIESYVKGEPDYEAWCSVCGGYFRSPNRAWVERQTAKHQCKPPSPAEVRES